MTAQIHTIDGTLIDARIAGLYQTPGFWRGRAKVRSEEAASLWHISQQKSGHQAQLAQTYLDNAMMLEK